MINHYTLPDGRVQVAFSGGRTSAYLLRQLLDANGGLPGRAVITFQNTGRERPETLDFVQETGSRWGASITWLEWRPSLGRANPYLNPRIAGRYEEFFGSARLARMRDWWAREATDAGFAIVSHDSASRSSEPFEALCLSRLYLPNQQARFCTADLKVRTAQRFLRSIGWDRWTNAVGLRADEPRRLNKQPKERWTVWHPLASAGVDRATISAFWSVQPFDLRLPNVKGNCWLGNCDGCFLKSEASVAAFTRDFPDDARWWEGMEFVIPSTKGKSGAALTWSKRYTRADMRTFMDRQGDWALSTEGALCQADDGECTA